MTEEEAEVRLTPVDLSVKAEGEWEVSKMILRFEHLTFVGFFLLKILLFF